jgi:hypothetical protein
MRRNKTIFVSLAVIVPLVAAIGVKKVMGSEPPGRLVVSTDGLTVYDNVTGLTWERNEEAGQPNTANSAAYCASYTSTAFASGWRLPTIKELVSIVDYELPNPPLIDLSIFPEPPTMPAGGLYWTSTNNPVDGQNYVVNFTNGQIESETSTGGGTYNNGTGLDVRCVHSAGLPDAGP